MTRPVRPWMDKLARRLRRAGSRLWRRRPPSRQVVAVLAFLALAAAAVAIFRPVRLAHPLAGPSSLPGWIHTAYGPMNVERDYLPGVVDCELGWLTANPSVLEAQAIAARTYLAHHLDEHGLDAEVPIGPRFQCWRAARNPRSREAVLATRGAVLRVGGGLIYANYASGANRLDATCTPPPPTTFGYRYPSWDELRRAWERGERFSGYAWTEILVTHNRGRRHDLRRTPQASPNDRNRGALGQYAAVCLADRDDLDTVALLRHFYGPDVEVWTDRTRLR